METISRKHVFQVSFKTRQMSETINTEKLANACKNSAEALNELSEKVAHACRSFAADMEDIAKNIDALEKQPHSEKYGKFYDHYYKK